MSLLPCVITVMPRLPRRAVAKKSTRSFRRTSDLFKKYSLEPSRLTWRETATSAYSTGKNFLWFSKYRAAWARPTRGRFGVPAKMRSSPLLPRRFRASRSPKSQRMASIMFDFPEPLGPTMAVMPAGNSKTVLPAKDLKPFSSRRFRRWGMGLSDRDRNRISHYFGLVTLFAIHYFRSLRGVGGLDGLGAFGAGAIEKRERSAAADAVFVAAVETAARDGNKRFAIHFQLLLDKAIIPAAVYAGQNLVQDGIRHVFDVVRDGLRFHGLLATGLGYVILPAESSRQSVLSRKRSVVLGNRFVIREWRHGQRKEQTITPRRRKLTDYFLAQTVVFFRFVTLVQNTMARFLQAVTSEAIFTAPRGQAIFQVMA